MTSWPPQISEMPATLPDTVFLVRGVQGAQMEVVSVTHPDGVYWLDDIERLLRSTHPDLDSAEARHTEWFSYVSASRTSKLRALFVQASPVTVTVENGSPPLVRLVFDEDGRPRAHYFMVPDATLISGRVDPCGAEAWDRSDRDRFLAWLGCTPAGAS